MKKNDTQTITARRADHRAALSKKYAFFIRLAVEALIWFVAIAAAYDLGHAAINKLM